MNHVTVRSFWPRSYLIPYMAILAVACLFFTGCASTGQEPGSRVARMAGLAAYIGTAKRLAAHPEERAVFELAATALAGLAARQDYDPLKFAEVVGQLPVLRGKDAELYAAGVVLLWDEALAASTVIDRAPLVKATMEAVQAGIARGLKASQ